MQASRSGGERPLLLLIGSGARLYREYLFSSLRDAYRVHLLTSSEPTWELPYLSGSTTIESFDTEVVVAAAMRLAVVEPVVGVLCWDESKIFQAAVAAERLGLPGGQPEAVLRCRDKFRTREALAAAGVAQPEFALVGELEAALVEAERIGYPVVLKPRAAAASFGVVLISDATQLTANFAYSRDTEYPNRPRYAQEVLIERYLPEAEISVDAVIRHGRVTAVFLARKHLGYSPHFEETGHHVSHHDPLLHDAEFTDLLQRCHVAIGIIDGWTHSEFKLTADGPKVIEINGRLGGDFIPYLGWLASGIDAGLAAAAVACAEEPKLTPTRNLASSIRFFYPEHDDTIINTIGFDPAELPPEIDLSLPMAEPGQVVSPPPSGLISGRIAFATVVASTSEQCECALDQAGKALRLSTRPAAGEPDEHSGTSS
jgi:biotin carboxylase